MSGEDRARPSHHSQQWWFDLNPALPFWASEFKLDLGLWGRLAKAALASAKRSGYALDVLSRDGLTSRTVLMHLIRVSNANSLQEDTYLEVLPSPLMDYLLRLMGSYR